MSRDGQDEPFPGMPQDRQDEPLPDTRTDSKNVEAIAFWSIITFSICLVLVLFIFWFYRRSHRIFCVRKMEELLVDIAMIEWMLFEASNTGAGEHPIRDQSKATSTPGVAIKRASILGVPSRMPWQRVQALGNQSNSIFCNRTDGQSILRQSGTAVSDMIRVLVCVQGEDSTDSLKRSVIEALKGLCTHHHLDISKLCFCIVGDLPPESEFHVLRPPGEKFFGSEFKISFQTLYSVSHPVLHEITRSEDKDSCPLEVFPIICDVADYCLFLRDPPEPDRVDIDFEASRVSRRSRARQTSRRQSRNSDGSLCQVVVDTDELRRDSGAVSFLVGLSIVALKADDEAFVICRSGNYELEPHRNYKRELVNNWKFYEELQGTNLCGALLRIWALAVSHGSYNFIAHAKPFLDQMRSFSKVTMPMRPFFHCCKSRATKQHHKHQVSYIDILLNIFLTYRRDAPIIALSDTKTSYGTRRQSREAFVGTPIFERESLEASLLRRQAICRAARSKYLAREAHLVLSTNTDHRLFRPPRKEPCAAPLALMASDFDDSFDLANDQLFAKMSEYATLESLAVRIRAYYVSFLRNMNGDPESESGIDSGEEALHAACEAYTTAAETSGHVVDHVRKYLCEIAEPQTYKHLLAAIQTINCAEKNEGKLLMSHCVEVEIVGAENLRNADSNAIFFNALSDPYCTVEFVGKRWSKLRTETIHETLNPTWNFQGVLEDYDFGDDLLFSVWDHDTATFDDSLGTARLSGSLFERGVFEGTLLLSEVKGHYGATLNVRVRVMQSDKPAAILPRPRSLEEVLQRAQMVHKKLERAIRHTVKEARGECEDNGIPGANRITYFGNKTKLWDFVQRSTAARVRMQMHETLFTEGVVHRRSKHSVGHVEEILRSVRTTGFDPATMPEKSPFARQIITCESFTIMRYVLQVLQESNAVEIHSVKENWKEQMMIPQISIRASLNDCKVEGHPHMVNIIIRHAKIAALVESTEDWSSSLDTLQEVAMICKTLKLQDPHTHPSRWCLSFGQLKDLAEKAEEELGPDVYANATMTDIVKKYIWRRTEDARMSYACLKNWQKLRDIDIFVSHAWKENFPAFVQSVSQALSQRLQADETNLWICSLALFQTSNRALVKEQIGADLMDAPFDKALRHAKEVLVVRNATIDNYQRAWCVYEIFRARQLALKITIAGPHAFQDGSVNIMGCKASDPNDEKKIKDAIVNAGLEKELNSVVTEIKNKGGDATSHVHVTTDHHEWLAQRLPNYRRSRSRTLLSI